MSVTDDHKEENTCYYCGMPASAVDHTIPRIILESLREFKDTLQQMTRGRKLTVPCCGECNSMLGASYQRTLEERKQELKYRLRRKYKKLLAMPYWTDEQIDEFGFHLRDYIEESARQREVVEFRLRW
ncbi:unnamed protein product [marine sediment metagenome]|uniref:Uncharacterized protein n=1 Tax=marine sediment metagenome TaxID=412755 RepID=X0VF09_9ZZZZ